MRCIDVLFLMKKTSKKRRFQFLLIKVNNIPKKKTYGGKNRCLSLHKDPISWNYSLETAAQFDRKE
jgi:hypothetical protein